MITPAVLQVAATPTTPALALRPWSLEDAAPLVEAFRDAGLRRWTSHTAENEAEGTQWVRSQQQSWTAGDRFSFAVLEAQPGGLCGQLLAGVVLKGVAAGEPAAEVGYWTAAHARGKGVASRAVEALTGWAFDTFAAGGLERLELLHQVDNRASCRVAQKSRYDFHRMLPAAPPSFPQAGHLHVRRISP
ncbi:GNAT family N-acetyltransferase [Streptomyces sp. SAS_272]|uniref:GNAT family N-acetyltransferase n=1 Tax=Streptomyces sp. SAS_272 TaxID=3412747 RepID=UPI00403C5D94